MKLDKVIFLYDHAKVVWTRIDSSQWCVELHCFDRHVRVIHKGDPGQETTAFLIREHIAKFDIV